MKKTTVTPQTKRKRPALNPKTRENQLIAAAYDLAEQRILAGTASSQEVTHFLKMGSPKARIEQEKLEREVELLRAKTEALESEKNMSEMYARAIKAMQRYGGHGGDDEEYEDY